jgi:hypothetical protein
VRSGDQREEYGGLFSPEALCESVLLLSTKVEQKHDILGTVWGAAMVSNQFRGTGLVLVERILRTSGDRRWDQKGGSSALPDRRR